MAVNPADLDRLGRHALSLVPERATVGLGSGRAATAFVRALGERARAGAAIVGVPTSEETAALAREAGIHLVELDGRTLELTVDGADEVDPNLDLVKGWGGALVRERIVAAASARQVILVTPEKLVPALGTRGRLPVEVIPFARALVEKHLRDLGLAPAVRRAGDRPFVTDNGNHILDCGTEPIAEPARLEASIRRVPGVVDTGLFLGTAHTVLVAEPGGIRTLTPGRSAR